MENKILDDLEEPQNPKYAKKSFLQFCGAAFIYLLFLANASVIVTIVGSLIIPVVILLMLVGAMVLSILGMLNGLKSIRSGENSTWRKYIGAFGNVLLVLFAVTMLMVIGVDIYENFIK